MKIFRNLVLSIAICSISILIGCQDSQQKQASAPESAPPAMASHPLVSKEVTVNTPEPKPAATKDGIPKIVFPTTVHEIGKMVPDKYYDLEFSFKNEGTGQLVIERTHAPCGCTVPKLDNKIYEPGESGIIKVRYHAQKTAGTINKSLEVYSNDPASPMVKCIIKGAVELSATVEPSMLKLSLKAENAGSPPIIIKSTTDEPISIASIKDVGGTMTFDVDPEAKATEFVLTPKVDMDKLKQRPNGTIIISALAPEANQLSVSYSAPALFEVSRPRIIIQGAVANESQEKEVWITSNYDDTLEIESITSQKHYMEVIGQEKHDNRVKLTLKITPPEPEGTKRFFTDKVDVKIANSESLAINCSGWYARE